MAARAAVSSLAAMLLLVVLLAGAASAQSPSTPSGSSGCTSVLVSLSPCLNYISGNESTAPASCCTQLGKVVQSDPQCLCVALSADPASLGLSVNRTRALGLPDACNVKTPPVSDCKNKAGAPTAAPGEGAASGGGATGTKTTPSSSTTFENGAEGASPRGLAAGLIVAGVLALAAV